MTLQSIKLQTDVESGLSTSEAQSRIEKHGYNELQEQNKVSALALFIHQFKNPLIFILAIGAIVSFATNHTVDAVAITAIIFINAIISFWQEFKAQKGMEALKEMAAPTAEVKRGGQWINIPAREIVPGDLLKISTGDILAADVRIIEANRLAIDEAALTGESEPVDKQIGELDGENIGIGDQKNMGFMTTIVTIRHRAWCSCRHRYGN